MAIVSRAARALVAVAEGSRRCLPPAAASRRLRPCHPCRGRRRTGTGGVSGTVTDRPRAPSTGGRYTTTLGDTARRARHPGLPRPTAKWALPRSPCCRRRLPRPRAPSAPTRRRSCCGGLAPNRALATQRIYPYPVGRLADWSGGLGRLRTAPFTHQWLRVGMGMECQGRCCRRYRPFPLGVAFTGSRHRRCRHPLGLGHMGGVRPMGVILDTPLVRSSMVVPTGLRRVPHNCPSRRRPHPRRHHRHHRHRTRQQLRTV